MNSREFFDKVVLMRESQKEYFRTRNISALKKSKSLEKEIDDEIERVNQIISKPKVIQGTLFDN